MVLERRRVHPLLDVGPVERLHVVVRVGVDVGRVGAVERRIRVDRLGELEAVGVVGRLERAVRLGHDPEALRPGRERADRDVLVGLLLAFGGALVGHRAVRSRGVVERERAEIELGLGRADLLLAPRSGAGPGAVCGQELGHGCVAGEALEVHDGRRVEGVGARRLARPAAAPGTVAERRARGGPQAGVPGELVVVDAHPVLGRSRSFWRPMAVGARALPVRAARSGRAGRRPRRAPTARSSNVEDRHRTCGHGIAARPRRRYDLSPSIQEIASS